MLELIPDSIPGRPLTLLCLGAHSDDIELGCGGAILRCIQARPEIEVKWVVFSAKGERADEALRSANLFLQGAAAKDIDLKQFRDGFFPFNGSSVKEYFEELKRSVSPDLIFTHFREDMHQDHRLISELTWNTFRNNYILEYEIVKYDGDLGNPNVFVHLDRATCERKVRYILDTFSSQANRKWFSEDAY